MVATRTNRCEGQSTNEGEWLKLLAALDGLHAKPIPWGGVGSMRPLSRFPGGTSQNTRLRQIPIDSLLSDTENRLSWNARTTP